MFAPLGTHLHKWSLLYDVKVGPQFTTYVGEVSQNEKSIVNEYGNTWVSSAHKC